ncbi:MAG: glutamyl-tRNA reductase [Sandaracinus sp.]
MSAPDIFVVGLSYRTSPVETREKLAVPSGELEAAIARLKSEVALDEALLVATCNRVEIYGVAHDGAAPARALSWLERPLGEGALEGLTYERTGRDAVQHAFRVASSLDSMVVGEPQILGQVKDAYAAASSAGGLGTLLDRCFARAFAVAKRIRNETGIAAGTVSVSSVACDVAKGIFGDLRGKRVLLVGAGKMGESAAKHLAKQGARLIVLNRSLERAVQLAAACGGEPRTIAELPSELALADVAITSTSSDRFVITVDLMKDVIRARKHRQMFFIDIAVPRDVDPRVGEMDGVFVYDVDDLGKVAQENMAARKREADAAEKIIDGESREFEEWRKQQDLKPLIVGIRQHVQGTLMAELERTLPRLTGDKDKDRAALERMIEAMVNKVVHHPVAEVKRASERGEVDIVHAASRLFPIAPKADAAAGTEASLPPASTPVKTRG